MGESEWMDIWYSIVRFLTSDKLCFFLLYRFIKGLPVDHTHLSEELTQAIGLESMPKGISYIISTKVKMQRILCVCFSVHNIEKFNSYIHLIFP